jgi:hypothetical protein
MHDTRHVKYSIYAHECGHIPLLLDTHVERGLDHEGTGIRRCCPRGMGTLAVPIVVSNDSQIGKLVPVPLRPVPYDRIHLPHLPSRVWT